MIHSTTNTTSVILTVLEAIWAHMENWQICVFTLYHSSPRRLHTGYLFYNLGGGQGEAYIDETVQKDPKAVC